MSVYIADYFRPQGRHKVCPMMADTTAELVSFAKRLNVPAAFIVSRGQANESLDVWKSKRKKALKLGAISITRQEVEKLIEMKRFAPTETSFDPASFS